MGGALMKIAMTLVACALFAIGLGYSLALLTDYSYEHGIMDGAR